MSLSSIILRSKNANSAFDIKGINLRVFENKVIEEIINKKKIIKKNKIIMYNEKNNTEKY